MTGPFSDIRDAAFPIGWCMRFGLPCDGTNCCGGEYKQMLVVSLVHVEDCLNAAMEEAMKE